MGARARLMPIDPNGNPFAVMWLGAASEVAIGIASAQSAALDKELLLLCATVDCRIRQGENPTAGAADTLLPAKMWAYLPHHPGEKIAVIRESADGKLSITQAL